MSDYDRLGSGDGKVEGLSVILADIKWVLDRDKGVDGSYYEGDREMAAKLLRLNRELTVQLDDLLGDGGCEDGEV